MMHGSLFSGIGGFDLAAEWAGWANVFHCDFDPFCQTVLKHHFPYETSYSNIKETDFSGWKDRIDVLSGGFPCQPFSQAGKRLGTADNRHLWPEMLRAIREIRPRWVVGENVLGIVNWNAGLVFQQVCADLEAEGYAVQPYILPAAGVNAPHQRYRTWFVAYADGGTTSRTTGKDTAADESERIPERNEIQHAGKSGFVRGLFGFPDHVRYAYRRSQSKVGRTPTGTDAQSGRVCRIGRRGTPAYTAYEPDKDKQRQQGGNGKTYRRQTATLPKYGNISKDWADFPAQSPFCRGDDGLSGKWDGITFPRWYRETLKAYGNAIVPQVAYRIFKAINQFENSK